MPATARQLQQSRKIKPGWARLRQLGCELVTAVLGVHRKMCDFHVLALIWMQERNGDLLTMVLGDTVVDVFGSVGLVNSCRS